LGGETIPGNTAEERNHNLFNLSGHKKYRHRQQTSCDLPVSYRKLICIENASAGRRSDLGNTTCKKPSLYVAFIAFASIGFGMYILLSKHP
jgi:hypothetical protein